MSNRYIADRREPIAAISLVPMVGVVFVLACLFLAANAPARSVPLTLPLPVGGGCGAGPNATLEIAVAADGSAQVDDRSLTDEALRDRLVEFGRTPFGELLFVPDPDVRHERIVELVAYAQDAGIDKIVFLNSARPVQPSSNRR